MLLAAATIAPATIYLDYVDMNPSFQSFLFITGFSFAALVVASSLLWLWFRSPLVVVMTAMSWIILTIYGRFFGAAESSLLRVAILLALVGLMVLVTKMYHRQVAAWFLIASVMSLVATGIQLGFALTRPTLAHSSVQGSPPPSANSLYFILVDGYGPLTGLEAAGREFAVELEELGLTVVDDAISNYTATYSSVSNMLSLDHRYNHGSAPPAEVFSVLQGANRVRSVLEEAGWTYVHVESDWTGTRCGPSVTNCIENSWLNDFVWEFFQSSFFGQFLERALPNPHVTQGFRTIEAIKAHAQNADSGHDFVFAHVLLPHPPLQLAADCATVIDPRLLGQFYELFATAEVTELRKDGYQQQTRCLNQQLRALVSSLPDDASVIITSDHGPDLDGQLQKAPAIWSQQDIEQRFRIFHATRLPAGCDLGPNFDLVNLVRAELACITGASLPPIAPYLEISPFIWSEDEPRVLTEVELRLLSD